MNEWLRFSFSPFEKITFVYISKGKPLINTDTYVAAFFLYLNSYNYDQSLVISLITRSRG